jgi:hypothetical protein
MTTRPLSDAWGEGRNTVTVEMATLAIAAIGLGLGPLAAPGGEQPYGAVTGESGTGTRL